jgi:hypothetical protein
LRPLFVRAWLLVANSVVADETDIAGRWLSGDKTGWIEIQLVDGNPVGIAAGATDPADAHRLDTLNPGGSVAAPIARRIAEGLSDPSRPPASVRLVPPSTD